MLHSFLIPLHFSFLCKFLHHESPWYFELTCTFHALQSHLPQSKAQREISSLFLAIIILSKMMLVSTATTSSPSNWAGMTTFVMMKPWDNQKVSPETYRPDSFSQIIRGTSQVFIFADWATFFTGWWANCRCSSDIKEGTTCVYPILHNSQNESVLVVHMVSFLSPCISAAGSRKWEWWALHSCSAGPSSATFRSGPHLDGRRLNVYMINMFFYLLLLLFCSHLAVFSALPPSILATSDIHALKSRFLFSSFCFGG